VLKASDPLDQPPARLAGTDDRSPPFAFPAVLGKKVTAAFDGRRITSNGGVMVLATAARKPSLREIIRLMSV